MTETMQKWSSVALIVLSIGLGVAVVIFRDHLQDLMAYGLLGIFLVTFLSSTVPFVPMPGFISVIGGGALYPPLFVAIVASAGTSLGEMFGYIFGRSGSTFALERLRRGKTFPWIETHFRRYGGWVVFIFALIPNPIFDSVGVLAGALQYNPWRFFAFMIAGRFCRYLALALLGARLPLQ